MKLALQSLGCKLNQETVITEDQDNDFVKAKERCFLCATHPGCTERPVFDTCQNNVCNFRSIGKRTVMPNKCFNRLKL